MEDAQVKSSFHKSERLCGKTAISKLLARGRHGSVPGLRYTCLADNGLDHARVLVSVPKKIFKRAVKRNLYKRRIRESWRRQKHKIGEGVGIDILITYASKELLSYEEIHAAIGKIIEKVSRQNINSLGDE